MKKLHLKNVTLCRECAHWREEEKPEEWMSDQSARLCVKWTWDEPCYTSPEWFCVHGVPGGRSDK